MTDDVTRQVVERFAEGLRGVPAVVAVWAHGSWAGGDHRPGVSDLDLVAATERPLTGAVEERVVAVHRGIAEEFPSASAVHCAYVAAGTWDDLGREHPTWAHGELLRRPVTAVTRVELHRFGRVLYGPPPSAFVPPVDDRRLAEFVVEDLCSFWRPALGRPERWLRDVWVDLGLLTLARASVTLESGRLITKAEALGVLTTMGAPGEVVDDIRRRRYGHPAPSGAPALRPDRRAELTRAFLAPAIDEVVARHRHR
ncbi:nucleotidyltransferase domain-containing protein [Streptomyces sp. SCSIO 75703]|uniref:nucleotidyltransferase domain-containing protein n=1 Tax=unclassified Streptomyces TaxID=2593676 RepID=UPI00099BF9AC|nr:nucleotidyltransferase domain-containing protein [Streptomyces sp. TP-A0875]